ncbi:hypothetical protein G8770_17655 [Aestuariicella hydrocarbonica]|uniref:Uncharacterized protein n=1 Tax=Pseudomaricurvus hydrocarbonicus TaxID=1470433 RepID=A0A9E5MN81_9GAMM|nr:hypothetical protein [Aestuariicella hydrocarbonica]NHO67374.1 hypothetical protein [Aestuariicella hydrocarbonica]
MNHKKYIALETLISSVVNGCFSFIFAYLVFQKFSEISSNQILVDVIPQSLFVTFFAILVPTLITRHRLKKSTIPSLPYRSNLWPNHVLLRALTGGIAVAVLATGFHFIVLKALTVETFSLHSVLFYKVIYGVALSAMITPKAVLLSLTEYNKGKYT